MSADRGSPFSPVGLVTRGSLVEHRTTGTLVDECQVLTSQHLFGSDNSPIGNRVRFKGGFGSRQQLSSSGTVVAAGGYEKFQSPASHAEAIAHDWLLIRLDTCLGAQLGFAKLRPGPFGIGELRHVQSAGSPIGRNRGSGLTLDPACQISAVYALMWLTDCATLHGDSGGPIFRISMAGGKPQLEIYAIKSAGYMWKDAVPFAAGYENQATPVSLIVPLIARYLSHGITQVARP